MSKITFISDCKGWAYDVVFKQIISGLTDVICEIVYVNGTPADEFRKSIDSADIVVVSMTHLLRHVSDKSKVLMFLDSHRALGL